MQISPANVRPLLFFYDSPVIVLRRAHRGCCLPFSFAEPILDVLAKGAVLCIDELNINLHPKLVQFLVELFHDQKSNPKNAQLIFTTHETTILTQDIFRRDQVWFCDKNREQASELYPLSDFCPKKGKENLELGYLSGRYGALPLVRSFSEVQ